MDYPHEGVTKFRYAQIVTAALAYLATEQGHAVGLMSMENGRLAYLPARGGRVHLRAIIARVDRLRASAAWNAPDVVARGAQLLQRRGVGVVTSDFYDAEEETRRELRRVAQRGHDVAMLQVLSPDELRFPYAGQVELQDQESGEERLVDATAAAATYNAAVAAFLERTRAGALRDGIDHALLTTDVPPDVALRSYLLKRSARPALHGAPRTVAR
jgi:uncharacterized protein (DUF58 family)